MASQLKSTTDMASHNLCEGVPDSKVGNLGAKCAPAHIEKSSRLLEALLRLDEKYASDGSVNASKASCVTDIIKSAATSRPMLHARMMKGVSSHGPKPLRVQLVGNYVFSSAANTALNSVQALSPIGVQDFSSFAALYDLQRTLAMRVYWQLASSGNINGAVSYGMAYDPSNLGVYSGVTDVMTAEQHVGPGYLAGTGINISVLPTTTSQHHPGFNSWKIAVKDPKFGLRNDSTAANAVGGGYVGTSDTTAIVGWLKPFVAAAGGSLTTTFTLFVVYDVEFSSRT